MMISLCTLVVHLPSGVESTPERLMSGWSWWWSWAAMGRRNHKCKPEFQFWTGLLSFCRVRQHEPVCIKVHAEYLQLCMIVQSPHSAQCWERCMEVESSSKAVEVAMRTLPDNQKWWWKSFLCFVLFPIYLAASMEEQSASSVTLSFKDICPYNIAPPYKFCICV